MTVADILDVKGNVVSTVRADATIYHVANELKSRCIGAAIVSTDGVTIEGIISERDIAYGIATYSVSLATMTVDQLMISGVVACSPNDTIYDVMCVMTQRRIRHLPVQRGDRLVGIISIGDVLKHRLREVQMEADVLRDYAIARR